MLDGGTSIRTKGGMMRITVVLFVLAAVAFSVSGCQELETPSSPSSSLEVLTTGVAVSQTTATPPAGETTTSAASSPGILTTVPSSTSTTAAPGSTDAAPNTTAAVVPTLSPESIGYAEDLGGTSHQGETLYFVIGASVQTEAEALDLLEGAKAVGDMQSCFIVQRSDNFEGMNPGWWVVFEAYREYPSQENLAFCRRPFPGAYVKSAIVKTSDPIPVYEDMLGL